jgi:hypothetical protein
VFLQVILFQKPTHHFCNGARSLRSPQRWGQGQRPCHACRQGQEGDTALGIEGCAHSGTHDGEFPSDRLTRRVIVPLLKITIHYCAIWCKITDVPAPWRVMCCVSQYALSMTPQRLPHPCYGAEDKTGGDRVTFTTRPREGSHTCVAPSGSA